MADDMNAPNPLLAPAPCPRLERAINRMVRDLASPLTLADLAEAAHYSPWYLVRRFQVHYQTTPQAFLWRLRLDDLIQMACATAGRTLTPDEVKYYLGDASAAPCTGR